MATVFAFIFGYLSIAFLLRFLTTHSMMVFVVYRLVLGAIVIALTARDDQLGVSTTSNSRARSTSSRTRGRRPTGARWRTDGRPPGTPAAPRAGPGAPTSP